MNPRSAVEAAPALPGVYFFYSNDRQLLYIGKAKDLSRRLRQHFPKTQSVTARPTRQMVAAASTELVCWALCTAELHALVLEDRLIKEYMPIVNKRQKKFRLQRYIAIKPGTPPRFISAETGNAPEGGRLFGPFSDKFYVETIFDIAADYFGLTDSVGRYSLRKTAESKESIQAFTDFLAGADRGVLGSIESKMTRCAGENRYEEAAKHREKLEFCSRFLDRQSFVSRFSSSNLEITGCPDEPMVFRRGAFLEDEAPDRFVNSTRSWQLFDRALVVYTWLKSGGAGCEWRYREPST